MSVTRTVGKYWKENRGELIITALIFTNLFPVYFPAFLYYVGVGLIFFKMSKLKTRPNSNCSIGYVMIMVAVISSMLNGFVDPRLGAFIAVLILCYPMVTSLQWHHWKRKLMKNLFMGFGGVTLINFIGKLRGVNNSLLKWDGSEIGYSLVQEFSGYASHPMWTSCAAALSALYFLYLVFNYQTKTILVKWLFGGMAFLSVYVLVISASRSALALLLGCGLLMLRWSMKDMARIVKYLFVIGVVGLLSFSFFMENMGAIKRKQDYQESVGHTSRYEKWGELMAEFRESPIYGVGFAVHGTGQYKSIGRYETGSGWLAILGQMGVAGFIVAILMWKKALTPILMFRQDKWMIMLYSGFIFFSLHSIMEGYMIQAGWYLCFIFWLIVGLLIENKKYYNIQSQ